MTSLFLVGGFVAIIGILIFIVVRVAKSSGRTTAERNALKEGGKRRERFDEEISKRTARGRELISRLRDMGR